MEKDELTRRPSREYNFRLNPGCNFDLRLESCHEIMLKTNQFVLSGWILLFVRPITLHYITLYVEIHI